MNAGDGIRIEAGRRSGLGSVFDGDGPFKNGLTRAPGIGENVDLRVNLIRLMPGDLFLMGPSPNRGGGGNSDYAEICGGGLMDAV